MHTDIMKQENSIPSIDHVNPEIAPSCLPNYCMWNLHCENSLIWAHRDLSGDESCHAMSQCCQIFSHDLLVLHLPTNMMYNTTDLCYPLIMTTNIPIHQCYKHCVYHLKICGYFVAFLWCFQVIPKNLCEPQTAMNRHEFKRINFEPFSECLWMQSPTMW